MSERGRRLPAMTLALCAAALSACAGNPPAARTPADATLAAREAHCRDRMYIERGGRGRAAVNWNVYEMCMREGGGANAAR